MDSVTSSPEKGYNSDAINQTHADLLRAFQGFRPGRRGPSKTPQPPTTTSSQQTNSPALKNSQATKAGISATQQESSSTPPMTQDTSTRKRPRRSTYKDRTEENESSDSDTPLTQTLKRPRQGSSKESEKPEGGSPSKQTSTAPKQTFEVQVHNGISRVEKASQALKTQHIGSNLQGEQGRLSMTPEDAATSIEGLNGQQQLNGAFQYQPPTHVFGPVTAQSSKEFATRLRNEPQKLAETLAQKNSSFLLSVPPTAASYLEIKLAQVTAEATRLHQEKVDAIRLEYVAELQRDMDERQKVIDMLMRNSDA